MVINSFILQVIATSDPIQFVHKNDCNCNNSLSQSNCMDHIKIGQVSKKMYKSFKCKIATALIGDKALSMTINWLGSNLESSYISNHKQQLC